jgi:hypothetical protein
LGSDRREVSSLQQNSSQISTVANALAISNG